jgi:hypothetical protein
MAQKRYTMDHKVFQNNGITFENGIVIPFIDYKGQMEQYGDNRGRSKQRYKASFDACKRNKMFYEPISELFTSISDDLREFIPRKNSYLIFTEEGLEERYIFNQNTLESPKKIIQSLQSTWRLISPESRIKDPFFGANFTSEEAKEKFFAEIGQDMLRKESEKIQKFLSIDSSNFKDKWEIGTISRDSIEEFIGDNYLFSQNI